MIVPLRQSDRAFGLTMTVALTLVVLIAYFAFGAWLPWLLGVAGAFLSAAVLAPGILLPLNRLWSLLAGRLGHVNNFLLLGFFFYVVVTPIGAIMRIFTDPLSRKIEPTARSYWTAVGRKADPETYRDLF